MRHIVLLCSALVMLAACSHGSTPEPVNGLNWPPTANEFIQDAIDSGADSRQVEILQAIFAAGGEVSIEVAQEAIDDTFTCFAKSGIPAQKELNYQDAFPVPGYSFSSIPGVSDEESLAIADSCIDRHSFFVEMLYQTQPRAQELAQQKFQIMQPMVVACLKDHGEDPPDDATADEIIKLALLFEQNGGSDCIWEADQAAVAQMMQGETGD